MSDEDTDEMEAAWVRQCEAEDASERARLAAQRDRADLTPLSPAPGAWIVESHWRPLSGKDGSTVLLRSRARDDQGEAQREGMSLACCAGILAVRVIAPSGAVVESYDREGNFWLCHDGVPSA